MPPVSEGTGTRAAILSALGVVLMRDPWDAEYLAPGVVAIGAYGWQTLWRMLY